MVDVVDVASEIEAENIAVILANRTKPLEGPSAIYCEECECAIPEPRRIALPGVQTCVSCAQLNEDKTAFQQGRFK